jgi:hypothetical protein
VCEKLARENRGGATTHALDEAPLTRLDNPYAMALPASDLFVANWWCDWKISLWGGHDEALADLHGFKPYA